MTGIGRSTGVRGRDRVMHVAARFAHALLIGFEIEIEMRERVVIDVARRIPERVEFGQTVDRRLPAVDET